MFPGGELPQISLMRVYILGAADETSSAFCHSIFLPLSLYSACYFIISVKLKVKLVEMQGRLANQNCIRR